MPLMSWDARYSVNEAVLDSQHQKFFSLLNSVYEKVMNSVELDNILPLIDDLQGYIQSHFTAEEKFMQENEFQEIDAHIAKHLEFAHTIERLKADYQGDNLEVARELIIFLGEWLLQHVLKEDRKYSELKVAYQQG